MCLTSCGECSAILRSDLESNEVCFVIFVQYTVQSCVSLEGSREVLVSQY